MEALLLQQFARFPRAGSVKSRLHGTLSPQEACDVHCELMQLTTQSLGAAHLGAVELWLDEVAAHPALDACRRAGAQSLRQQCGADLGERMLHALTDGLRRAGGVILVGSDCPGLDAHYLREAAASLETVDIVLGPAEDGGFVLVGARRSMPGMFAEVDWGRADVLLKTRAALRRCDLSLRELPLRYDVDRPEDLRRWRGG